MGKRLLIIGAFLFGGCTQGHCHHKTDLPEASTLPQNEELPSGPPADTIYVYKYDGSLQCGMGSATTVESMAKELKDIPISKSEKKSDGLAHIQVCGSITGQANVYQIPAKFMKKAEKKGFKKWTFEQ